MLCFDLIANLSELRVKCGHFFSFVCIDVAEFDLVPDVEIVFRLCLLLTEQQFLQAPFEKLFQRIKL